jgi:hypothetical protein
MRIQISMPNGPYWKQFAVFSGDKWYHNWPFLNTIGPDGLSYDYFDECLGKDPDRTLMRESELNKVLKDLQLPNPLNQHQLDQLGLVQYVSYTDKVKLNIINDKNK